MAFPLIKVLSWSPLDTITADKLNDMVNNDNLLQENMVRGYYNGLVKKDTGIRIAAGLVVVTARKSNVASVPVTFGDFFSAGCNPIVTTGANATSQRQIYVTIDGPGSAILPDRTGFSAVAWVDSTSKTKKITHSFYISWIALGW
jgi:hypothetical protein